jgi:hypothetical protein
MRAISFVAVALGAGLLISCTPRVRPGVPPLSPKLEEIRISRGPCFGFCPVYTVAVTPAGRVDFTGERHTAVLGPRARSAGRETYEAVRKALASARPRTGEARAQPCPSAATDMAQMTVEWIAASGTRTALTYNLGCREPATAKLAQTVEAQLQALQVADWAAQKTWPGDTRG